MGIRNSILDFLKSYKLVIETATIRVQININLKPSSLLKINQKSIKTTESLKNHLGKEDLWE